MSSPYHCISKKVSDCFAALLISQGPTSGVPVVFKLSSAPVGNPGIPIFRTASFDDEVTPRIEIYTTNSKPERQGELVTGNYWVTPSIRVMSHCDDMTRDAHYALAATVGDILFQKTADMIAALNGLGIPDFTALAEYFVSDVNDKPVNHEFETEYICSIKVMPS